MRRGATAYEAAKAGEELGMLADKARAAADRASDSIDDVLSFVDALTIKLSARMKQSNLSKSRLKI